MGELLSLSRGCASRWRWTMSKHDHRAFDLVAIARDVATREGFVVDFPKAPASVENVTPHGVATAIDERHLLWSSVDNRESTDLDQIEVAERLPNDVLRIKLGIADVDAFVPQ